MTFEGNGGDSIPRHHKIPHYHGDMVRGLFLVAAITLVVAQSTGTELPLSAVSAVVSAALLVVAAGITSPTQSWIHWVNALFACIGTLLFGTTAVEHYRAGMSVFDPSFASVEALALLSLFALYFTTRTIRGVLLRSNLS